MAIKGNIEVSCPKGCDAREVEVWSFVRGDKDAELRESLLAGELNLLVCEDCGALFYPEVSMVYCDPPAAILIFSFPESYKSDEARWRQKMREDYEHMRAVFADNHMLDVEPILVFGLEPLRNMLRQDDEMEDEVRIAEHLAKNLRLKVIGTERAYAREHKLPWRLPCAVGDGRPTLVAAVAGLKAILKANPRLSGYRRWLKTIETVGSLPPFDQRSGVMAK